MDGFELATADVLVALQPDNGRAALELRFARDIPAEFAEHARHADLIMLDHVLGEYDFAVKWARWTLWAKTTTTPMCRGRRWPAAPVFDAF